MGNRLSKIYTRTGDKGTTGLGDGKRIAKNSTTIEVIGCLDELNAHLGLLMADVDSLENVHHVLLDIQHDLFDLGGEIVMPGYHAINDKHVSHLESVLDGWNQALPPLKEFILPSGDRAIALTHVARTVCRRAERRLVELASHTEVNAAAIGYINRLSDLLFVMAREIARLRSVPEVFWKHERRAPLKD